MAGACPAPEGRAAAVPHRVGPADAQERAEERAVQRQDSGGGGTSGAGATAGTVGTGGAGGSTGGAGSGGAAGAGAGQGGSGGPDGSTNGPDGAADTGGDVAPPPPRSTFVYVGSSTSADIQIFQLDLQTGALMARGTARSGAGPTYMAFHPGGKYAYALSEQTAQPGRIFAFSINPQSGALTRLNDAGSGGTGPAHVSVHKSGKWLLAANYQSGHAGVLPIAPDGRLGDPVTPVVRAGGQAHMIVDDGVTGKFVFVPSKMDDRTLMYRFDEATGALTPNSPGSVAQAGSPRHMSFHRNGMYAYLLTEAGRSVVSYRYDSTTGLLTDGMARSASPEPGSDGAHILVHPTRDFIYASIRALGPGSGGGSIATFPIGPDGRAGQPTQVSTQIARPWDFDIDPSGRFLIVVNNDAANIRVFRINEQTGALTLAGNGASVPARPRFVGIFAPPPG